jgi:hypothetical protein
MHKIIFWQHFRFLIFRRVVILSAISPLKSNDQEQWELELPVVIVPTLTQFRYKYMVLSPSDEKNVPQMEPAHDHVITLEQFSDHITITDVWGVRSLVVLFGSRV